jgi:1-acyl-sn-glycerol-3-phosphate acyltransferase
MSRSEGAAAKPLPRYRRRVILVSRAIVRPMLHGPLMRVHSVGRDLVPTEGPVILAGNHSSWLDGPIVVAENKRLVRCLTKVEMFKGAVGRYLAVIGQIPIDRSRPDRTALQTSLQVLADGGVLGMFPEGTRGSGDLEAVHDGVAWLAVRSGARIVPVACLGTAAALPKGAKFPKRVPVTVVFGEPFDITMPANPRSRTALKQVSEEIRQHLVKHLAAARAAHG